MPTADDEARPGETKMTRVFADLHEMIFWINEVEGGTSAELLDPMIRHPLGVKYATLKADIDALKKIRAKKKKG